MLSRYFCAIVACFTAASVLATAPPVSADFTTSAEFALATSGSKGSRELPDNMYVAYWSVWERPDDIPDAKQLEGVTHLVIAFANMTDFATFAVSQPVTLNENTISQLRQNTNLKIMASFGGWNLDQPFRPAASSPENRATFAQNITTFVDKFQLDGVDIDWEFPVDNGPFYHLPEDDPDARRYDPADAQNFVDLMAEIRKTLPEDKLLSIDVPARLADIVAYNMTGIVAGLDQSVDYWNIMTYDSINRRDNITAYHAGAPVMESSFNVYSRDHKIDPKKIVMGFPMYAKWFQSTQECTSNPPIGCDLANTFEFPNGSDTGLSGTAWWSYSTDSWQYRANLTPDATLNQTAYESFGRLPKDSDSKVGASAWYDAENHLYWTWVSPQDIEFTCNKYKDKVRGMAVWSLNQDTQDLPHISAIAKCMKASTSGSSSRRSHRRKFGHRG